MSNKTQLYTVTSFGAPYIQLDDIINLYDAGIPIIGTAEFILSIFNCPAYEIDDINYPAECLPTETKIQVLIDDGFIEEYNPQ